MKCFPCPRPQTERFGKELFFARAKKQIQRIGKGGLRDRYRYFRLWSMRKSRRSLSANLLVFLLSVMPYKANRENHSMGGLSADIREVPPPLNQPPASRITACVCG